MAEIFYKHTYLENDLRRQILSGILPESKPILSENILAKKYQLSRNTIRHAIDNLIKEGLLYRVRGSGTYIVPRVQRKQKHTSIRGKRTILYLTFPPYSNNTYQNGTSAYFNDVQYLLKRRKYELHFEHISTPEQVPEALHNGTVAGIIFNGNVPDDYFLRYIQPYPCIKLDCSKPYFKYCGIDNGKFTVGEMSVQYLYQAGHRRIGFLSDECETPDSQALQNGYRTAMRDLGLAIQPEWECCWMRSTVSGELGEESIFYPRDYTEYLTQFFETESPPTALICYDNWRAVCTLQTLKKMGRNVPEDVSIICSFVHEEYPFYMQKTRFTCYQLRTRDIWLEGVQMLFELIDSGEKLKKKTLCLIPFFVPGETVKKLQ